MERGAGGDNGERQLSPQGQDRKAEIVREAERLFTERGFTSTRMSDIAEAAGVTKGLLYWYFENKQALLTEIVADMRTRLQEAQREASAGVDDVLGRLYVGTVASVRFVRANQKVYGLITYSGWSSELAPALHESATAHASDTAKLIERGQREGVVRDDDSPAMLAHGNAGVVNNYCAAAAWGRLKLDDEELAHVAARYIIRSLAATPELADATVAAHGRGSPVRKRNRSTVG
jgi:AcrR family transcriptional regulator